MAGHQLTGQCRGEICPGALRNHRRLHRAVILHHAVPNLVERGDFAGQLLVERNHKIRGDAVDRAGKGIVGRQREGGLGEYLQRGG